MMKKFLSALGATIMAAAFALPLNAAPVFAPKHEQVRANIVELVKHRKGWRGNGYWRNGRHWNDRYAWWSCRYYGTCYPRRNYGKHNYYPRYYRPYDPRYYPRYYRNGPYYGYRD